jgi:hypothetical protein
MVVLRQRRKELRELLFLFFQETKEREREREHKSARSVHTHVRGEKKLLKKNFEIFPQTRFLSTHKKEREATNLTPTVAGSKHIASDSSNIARSSLAREKKFSVSSLFCSPSSFVVGSSSSFIFFFFFVLGSCGREKHFQRSTFFLV